MTLRHTVKSFLVFLSLIFIFEFSGWSTNRIDEDPGSDLYNVQKLDNTFYQAKIPGKDLYLAMERVHAGNHSTWLKYAKVQAHERVIMVASRCMKGMTGDGSRHFKSVLEKTCYGRNEIWIAYITKAKPPQKIPRDMDYYTNEHVMPGEHQPFAKDIEMFVTVTSNPKALVTSHMGVSISAEAAISGERTKGTSVHLHSFAAKVMLMRNPERKYQVHAPVFAMEEILMKAIPQSVFVGTREMKQIMEEGQRMTFEEFKNAKLPKMREELEQKEDERRGWLNEDLEYLKSDLEEGSITEETAKNRRSSILEKIEQSPYFELTVEGKVGFSENKVNAFLEEKLPKEFKGAKNPYYFPTFNAKTLYEEALYTEEFLKCMEKHPPILSVDGKSGASIKNRLTIYNPENPTTPWLVIDDKNRETYQWIFTEPFQADGLTHYIAVGLEALADSRYAYRIRD